MKHFVSIIVATLICVNLSAQKSQQEGKIPTVQLDSMSAHFLMRTSQHTAPAHKLYKTNNMWTFLELQTYTGIIWQVQYSTKGYEYRFKTILNAEDLTDGNPQGQFSGRFELYPTDNMYNFILLDTFTGRTWQVQWSTEANERCILPIY